MYYFNKAYQTNINQYICLTKCIRITLDISLYILYAFYTFIIMLCFTFHAYFNTFFTYLPLCTPLNDYYLLYNAIIKIIY